MRYVGRIAALAFLLILLVLTVQDIARQTLPFPLFGATRLVRLILMVLCVWFYLWQDDGQ